MGRHAISSKQCSANMQAKDRSTVITSAAPRPKVCFQPTPQIRFGIRAHCVRANAHDS